MTKEQCLTCEGLDLADAGDHYVATARAFCKKESDAVVDDDGHPVNREKLIYESVIDEKHCPMHKKRE